MKRTIFVNCRSQNQNQIRQSYYLQQTRQQSEFISNKNKKDVQMPTPLSLGFDIKYQKASNNSKRRTCAVVAGWMGAKENQMKKYLTFYHSRGIDTLSFAVGPNHVLFPATAMEQMERVLKAVQNSSEDSQRPIDSLIFHHFSVGGFLFGQMLRLFETNPQIAHQIKPLIKAQIFDSPPDFQNIAKGVSHSVGLGPPVSSIVELFLRGYLKVTENTAGVQHRAASKALHENKTPAPSLWFYSKSDPVARWEDCEIVMNKMRAKGTIVEQCVWDNTPHIQHARLDPDRYFNTLEIFLKTHNTYHHEEINR
mmetsp:Transcript_9660/g.9446  ORF Transcript_9660/g.9446 Transcript_9660/m.9446 type:complete len:309 (-) Transcript_9660:47-973(-)